jgi:hypothetical protein
VAQDLHDAEEEIESLDKVVKCAVFMVRRPFPVFAIIAALFAPCEAGVDGVPD